MDKPIDWENLTENELYLLIRHGKTLALVQAARREQVRRLEADLDVQIQGSVPRPLDENDDEIPF